jgi:uncharacterized membrane protein YhfC
MDLITFTHLLNGLLMIAMPVGLGIFLARRFHLSWRLWWIGAGTFFLSQVGHIPFNAGLTVLFQRGVLPSPAAEWKLPFNAITLGLSAGLWEELSRYAAYRWWAKDARNWRKGILMGAGHGGLEAIILGLLVLFTLVSMLSVRNSDLSKLVPPDQLELAQSQIIAYWNSPVFLTLFGALERAFTIPVQIALSVLVLQAFTRNHIRWLFAAIGWHALVDCLAVLMVSTRGVYLTEALIGVESLISVAFIFILRQPEPELPVQPPPPEMLQVSELREIEESTENLEKTRYN